MDHLMKEALEIWLHPSNFSTDGSYTLSQAWYAMTNMLNPLSPMVAICPTCFNNQYLFILYLWVLYDSHYKQGLFPQTALTS
jgi:hypothetical protein